MDEQRLLPLAPGELASDRDYVGVSVCDGELTAERLDGVALDGSFLCRVRGQGIAWRDLRASDVVIRDCDLANAVWEKAYGESLTLQKCRLTGWNVADGVFRKMRVVGCQIRLGMFHGAALTDCSFEGCNLCEADFQGARLKDVVFRRCDLRSARFAGAALETVDFRGSHLAGIQLDADRLRGNVFDPSQLPILAGVLGLVVKDVEEDEPRQRP